MATKSIKSILPKKHEFALWPAEKVISLIVFSGLFVATDQDGVTRDEVTQKKIEVMKETDDPFWKEFMKRIMKKDISENNFRLRLKAFTQNCGAFLQENPLSVTPEINNAVKDNPRWRWVLTPFAEKKNAMGGSGIVPANSSTPVADTKTPLARYHQGLLNVATVFEKLMKGISQEDINKMSVDKRIRMANNLLHSLSRAVTAQQNTKVFNTIVINKAGREDLEKSMLEYAETQNIQSE